jgi:hemoglobin
MSSSPVSGWGSPSTPPRSVVSADRNIHRLRPDLTFQAAVALRFESPLSVGETPDGVRLDFTVQGTVAGPGLNGKFPLCAAYLRIDVDGVGTIHVRAPLLFNDGAMAEMEATGRYDFGEDGYRRAVAKDLPNSALGWCPRFFTGHPRYLWLNRALFLGIGELRPREARVDYDLFLIGSQTSTTRETAGNEKSLYERLGGNKALEKMAREFLDALLDSATLNRQNPKVAEAHARFNTPDLRRQGTQSLTTLFCQLTGGPCQYNGRSLKEAHAPLEISNADWAVMAKELIKVLQRNGVPRPEQQQFLAIIEQKKSDIVTRR